jgi:processive 1,2-diacylglycerol beta-glucosyltransferase
MSRAMRVLILSADVGESHAAMARALARGLERHPEVEAAAVLSDFAMLGPLLAKVLRRGFEYHLGRVQWSYDLAYRLFTGVRAAQRLGERSLYALGARALLGNIEREAPDVVVSTYPVLNPVLSELRRRGRLRCPLALVVGPLGGLGFWIQPGADLHLLHYPQVRAEVERIAGPGRAVHVRPLVREEFFERCSQQRARELLGIPARGQLVLVSGGGWGAGDLASAVQVCLSLGEARVIAVCGRNEEQRQALAARFAGEQRVEVLGFTERMRALLWAADAFVTATAGLSVIEARLCGCPSVCFGFAFGHVRDNTRALARGGLVRVAETPAQLAGALGAALAEGRWEPPSFEGVPSAAEATLALWRGEAAALTTAPS